MSGLATSKDEIQKRLAFHRGFKKHGFRMELVSHGYDNIRNQVALIRQGGNSHLTKEINVVMTSATKAKLASDLSGLEAAKFELKKLCDVHGIRT